MKQLTFDWDKRKAFSNIEKHGVSFEEARTVFYDEYALLKSDPAHSDDEDRFLLLGVSAHSRVMVVCHCYRRNDEVIRIISARKATNAERKHYVGRRNR